MLRHGNPVRDGAGAGGGSGEGIQGRAGAAGGCFRDHQGGSLPQRRCCHGSPDQSPVCTLSHSGIQ